MCPFVCVGGLIKLPIAFVLFFFPLCVVVARVVDSLTRSEPLSSCAKETLAKSSSLLRQTKTPCVDTYRCSQNESQIRIMNRADKAPASGTCIKACGEKAEQVEIRVAVAVLPKYTRFCLLHNLYKGPSSRAARNWLKNRIFIPRLSQTTRTFSTRVREAIQDPQCRIAGALIDEIELPNSAGSASFVFLS